MIKGYERAAAEYEAKMSDPYADEDTQLYDPDWFDHYEEMLLERQADDYCFRG